LPEVNKLFKDGLGIYNTDQEQDFINEMFPVCQNISIDYGVMEKARNVYVLASDFGWSDLGTWGSLYSIREKDDEQNTIVGNNVMTYDTSNCIVNVPKDKLVVLQGLDDFIIVEEDGVLLVCKKENEQMIRKFVDDVGEQKGKQFV
jgi:mannose-1-phosphate guanylyltransferase